MIWEAKQHGFELPRPKVRALLFNAAEAEGYARNHDDIYCDFLPIEGDNERKSPNIIQENSCRPRASDVRAPRASP